jgi:flavodoxin
MKALVTYYSRTGNTEQLARAISDALPSDKTLLPVAEVKEIKGYDLVLIGFPVEMHSVPTQVHPLFKALPKGQPIALFSTHGSLRGGRLYKQAMEHALSLSAGAVVLGSFESRGKVDPQVLDKLIQSSPYQAWAEEAQGAHSHPTAADLADAKAFATAMLAKASHKG